MPAIRKIWKIHLKKVSPIILAKESVFQQIHGIMKMIEGKSLKQAKLNYQISKVKVAADIPEPEKVSENEYLYEFDVRVKKDRVYKVEVAEKHFEKALDLIRAKAITSDWQVQNLEVSKGISTPTKSAFHINQNLQDIKIPELTQEVLDSYFGRVYERSDHINIIYSAAKMAEQTNFEKRHHVLLYGLPACSKSSIFESFKNWFNSTTSNGEELIFSLDATTTTKAGLEIQLLSKAEEGVLPPFLLIEEIEKVDLNTMLCLLSVLDQSGKITRTNARIGNRSASAKIVCFATCNDINKIKEFQNGSLFSRFSHRLACCRPSIELMKKILQREANEMKIPEECREDVINKVMRFGIEGLKTTDPREFMSLLDGWRDINDFIKRYTNILVTEATEEK